MKLHLLSFALTVCCLGTSVIATSPVRIAFYGTLAGGLEEAERSRRPILLVSAAPHCHGVSGLW